MRQISRWAVPILGLALLAGALASAAPAARGTNRFVLFLYEGPGFESGGGHASEYAAWAKKLCEAGVEVSGEELSGDARAVLDARGTRRGRETGERLAGYFVVAARDLDAAAAIARDCPHLRHRGRIVVRALAS